MAAFQVVFLEMPQVGKSVTILYSGQQGSTGPISGVQLLPNQPDIYQVTTAAGVVMTGPVQGMSQSVPQSMPPASIESGQSSNGRQKNNNIACLGCLGLLLFVIIVGSLISSSSSVKSTSDSVPYEQTTPSTPSPNSADLVSNIQISNVRITDTTCASNGAPAQIIQCTITNNNDVPIYAVDGIYSLTLDGSGSLEPAGVKEIEYCIYASKLEPHQSHTESSSDGGFMVVAETQGRCTQAKITVTNVETTDWNK